MIFKTTLKNAVLTAMMMLFAVLSFAQVTTSSMVGNVKDAKGEDLIGATVIAVHTPSGTQYGTSTNENGRFSILNMRIGGPYKLTVSYLGFKTYEGEGSMLKLGEPAKLNLTLVEESTSLDQVEVVYKRNATINNQRTGASTSVGAATIANMPTLNRSITDITKLTPQAKGFSFAGMDSRYNNFQIDGSSFNNNFGLQELPGSQTNSTPISLDAIEQININLAPYDVRQGGFSGAAVNAVTRSGTNKFEGSAFTNYRSDALVGDSVGAVVNGVKKNYAVPKAAFDVKQIGFRLGGPIIKDKLFFFINGETELRTDPGTTYKADQDADVKNNDANTTRVQAADLNAMRDFLKSKYNYDPGEYENYSAKTTSYKALARIDYNINKNNKFNIRYNYLRSFRDVPPSNSGSTGGRTNNANSLAFSNSFYIINNDISSVIAELNSTIGSKISNKFNVGYTANRDYRSSNSTPFPLVDLRVGTTNYMSFGYEQFTPNNKLNTDTWQINDQMSYYAGKHTISAGFNMEHYKFVNTFTPNYYGQYAFTAATGADVVKLFQKSAAGDTSAVTTAYNLGYSILPDRSPWSATTKAYYAGLFLQDEWDVSDNFRLTLGVRADVPFYNETEPLYNPNVPNLVFFDENKSEVRISTGTLPGKEETTTIRAAALPRNNVVIAPRIGFNWDVNGDKKTQIRGGAGYFSGRPPFVWLSNNVGNNGMLSGSFSAPANSKKYPFSPAVDPRENPYSPKTVSAPASSYNVAVVDQNFKFPTTLRGSIGIDQKILDGMFILTLEGMLQSTVNDIRYVQGNMARSFENFTAGPDKRAKFPGGAKNTVNSVISNGGGGAMILKNTGNNTAKSFTAIIDKPLTKNWGGRIAYNYGMAKDLMHAGSIAYNSWTDAISVNGNNYLDRLGFSRNDQRHRIISNLTYRQAWGKVSATTINLYTEARNQGNYSYTVQGDINYDGLSGNELLYIPKADEKLTFVDIKTINATTKAVEVQFTAAQQAEAFEKFITNDTYLNANRGTYAERNGALLPWLYRFDLNIQQDFYVNIAGRQQTFQINGTIFNIANLFKNTWGVGYDLNNFDSNRFASAPLRAAIDEKAAVVGKVTDTEIKYQMVPVNGSLEWAPYRKSVSISDAWQAQVGVRWIF